MSFVAVFSFQQTLFSSQSKPRHIVLQLLNQRPEESATKTLAPPTISTGGEGRIRDAGEAGIVLELQYMLSDGQMARWPEIAKMAIYGHLAIWPSDHVQQIFASIPEKSYENVPQ